MSFTQFSAAVKPSIDARGEIASLKRQMDIAIARRDSADERTLALITRVGAAVKGDPNYGRNSDLCEAMGYTREVERRRNIRRGNRRRKARQRTGGD